MALRVSVPTPKRLLSLQAEKTTDGTVVRFDLKCVQFCDTVYVQQPQAAFAQYTLYSKEPSVLDDISDQMTAIIEKAATEAKLSRDFLIVVNDYEMLAAIFKDVSELVKQMCDVAHNFGGAAQAVALFLQLPHERRGSHLADRDTLFCDGNPVAVA
jgi:hypothetical protein